jgi:hypothetical protein
MPIASRSIRFLKIAKTGRNVSTMVVYLAVVAVRPSRMPRLAVVDPSRPGLYATKSIVLFETQQLVRWSHGLPVAIRKRSNA